MKYIKTFESFLNESYLFEAKDPMKSPIKVGKITFAYYSHGGEHNRPGKGYVKPAADILGVDASEIFYNNSANPTMQSAVEFLQNNAKFTKAGKLKKGKYKGIEFVTPVDDDSFIMMSRDAAQELANQSKTFESYLFEAKDPGAAERK